MELAIVIIVVAGAAFVVGRRAVRTWRRAAMPDSNAGPGCGGGGCAGCAPEPPKAKLVQLRRKS